MAWCDSVVSPRSIWVRQKIREDKRKEWFEFFIMKRGGEVVIKSPLFSILLPALRFTLFPLLVILFLNPIRTLVLGIQEACENLRWFFFFSCTFSPPASWRQTNDDVEPDTETLKEGLRVFVSRLLQGTNLMVFFGWSNRCLWGRGPFDFFSFCLLYSDEMFAKVYSLGFLLNGFRPNYEIQLFRFTDSQTWLFVFLILSMSVMYCLFALAFVLSM